LLTFFRLKVIKIFAKFFKIVNYFYFLDYIVFVLLFIYLLFFQLPYCVLADHTTKSIVVTVRGSFSLRDVFTDMTAGAERFDAPGMPPDSYAHNGMIVGAEKLIQRLRETNILERAFNSYPEYSLILTGHSLGAGVSILLGAKLRHKYPDLKVYAFATPAGLLSREAARYSESFAFTVGLGDDFVMRLGIDSTENFRTGIIETIRACKLPKVLNN